MNKNLKYALLLNPILNLISCYDDYDTIRQGGLTPTQATGYAWDITVDRFFSLENIFLFFGTLLVVWVIRLFFKKVNASNGTNQ